MIFINTTAKHRQPFPRGSPQCASQFDTNSYLTQSGIRLSESSQWTVVRYLLKTKIDRRGLTKDCLSCVHARCGFIVNTRAEENLLDRCRQKRRRVLCSIYCSSAAAAVAIGQLQFQLSHYSLVAWPQDPTNFFPCPGPHIGGPGLNFHKI